MPCFAARCAKPGEGAVVASAVRGDVAAVTRAPGRDRYVLWVTPLVVDVFPSTPCEVYGLVVAADGTPTGEPPFATLRGSAPVFAYDGDELRYAIVEDAVLDSAEDGVSRLRTGTISADGVVDAGAVVAAPPAELVTTTACVPTYHRAPPGGWSGEPSDDVDGCGGCQIAPGATRTALIVVGLLAAILPRRRRAAAARTAPRPTR